MTHKPVVHAALTERNTQSLLDTHTEELSSVLMQELSVRLRQRIKELGGDQKEYARAAQLSPQRFGNYVQGTRTPDIWVLARIAKALQVSTDWLLGVSDAGPIETKPLISRILELDGMHADRAQAIAEVAQAALRILSGLPDEGDVALRSRMAAQAAWQARDGSRPS